MVKTAETYHVPVLLNESIDGLNIQPGGIYVDVTFGVVDTLRKSLPESTETAISTVSTKMPMQKEMLWPIKTSPLYVPTSDI